MSSLLFKIVVQGYHVYRVVWELRVGLDALGGVGRLLVGTALGIVGTLVPQNFKATLQNSR